MAGRSMGRGKALIKALEERKIKEAQEKAFELSSIQEEESEDVGGLNDAVDERKRSDFKKFQIETEVKDLSFECASKINLKELNADDLFMVSSGPETQPSSHQPKHGDKGKCINLAVNFLEAKPEESSPGVFYEYKIKFSSTEAADGVEERMRLINLHPELKIRMFNGSHLIVPRKIKELKMESFSLDLVREVPYKECLKVFNMILNKSFRLLQIYPIRMNGSRSAQRRYFDPKQKKVSKEDKCEIWPGYITSVNASEGGVFLAFDLCSKIIREETAASVLANALRSSSDDMKGRACRALIGQTVITRYSNKTYKIEDVDFDKSPESTFQLKDGRTLNFMDYYKETYGIEVQDPRQPLLLAERKRTPETHGQEVAIMLVPELCFMCGLTEAQKSDFRIMKRIADFTRIKPTIR